MPNTYHTARHTLNATTFSQKNADMNAKYNMNPAKYKKNKIAETEIESDVNTERKGFFRNAAV